MPISAPFTSLSCECGFTCHREGGWSALAAIHPGEAASVSDLTDTDAYGMTYAAAARRHLGRWSWACRGKPSTSMFFPDAAVPTSAPPRPSCEVTPGGRTAACRSPSSRTRPTACRAARGAQQRQQLRRGYREACDRTFATEVPA